MPADLKNTKLDTAVNITEVKGVLYQGDNRHISIKNNVPIDSSYWSVHPDELSPVFNMVNEEEASKFMVKAIDFDEDNRTPMPDVDAPSTLTNFVISPERHEAYEKLWNTAVYLGVVANTAMWLYI